MRHRFIGWLGTWFLAWGALSLHGQESLRLEYKMKPGQVLKYRSWIRMASLNQPSQAPQPMRMQMEAEALYQETVQEADAETITYEIETLSGYLLMRMGDQERKIETPRSRERKVIDRWGEVRESVELDERGNPKEERGDTEPLADPLVIIDRILEHAAFPKEAVKPGDRWERTAEIRLGAERTLPVTLRLQWSRWVLLMGRRCAEILIRFSLPMEASRSDGRGGMEAQGQMSGEFTLYFDPERGVDVCQVGRVETGLSTRLSPPAELQEKLGRELPTIEVKMRGIYHLKAVLEE